MFKNILKVEKVKISLIIIFLILMLSTVIFLYFTNNSEVEALSKYGSRGEEVKQIQTKLKRWGYYNGNVDGIFGSQTRNAIYEFQRLYLFECKCFTGEKILSGQGTLKGKFSEANVYDQSMGHLALLFDYIQEYLRGSNPGVSPVQLVVFDGGLGECKDMREEKDKQVLQYVSFDTLNSWMQGELSKISGLNPVWDLRGIAEVIREFQKVNEESLNKHIERLSDKKG